ncbi:MAG: hypothetical protein VXW31_09965, partial [Planctomycetota bacterium]|nr:hypothetical protein [Planctomycetota bacterium]
MGRRQEVDRPARGRREEPERGAGAPRGQHPPGAEERPAAGPEVFQGTVETITYHDPRTLFGVLRLDPDPGFKAPETGSLFAPGRVTAV